MSNQEILEKAINLAIDGGWKSETLIPWRDGYGVQKLKSLEHLKEFDVEHIIFNHDFAKSIWNTPRWTDAGEGVHFETRDGRSEWQYHLQEMVIASDPIAYLGEHLEP